MNLQIQNLSFRFSSFGSFSEPVLNDINLNIEEGEFLALVGPSGSGKTTLMQHLTGLLKPDAGQIRVDNQDIFAKGFSLTALRKKIGLVFQFPETQLFEDSVYKDVAFGPRNLGLPENEVAVRVEEAIENVRLDFEKFKNRIPFHLSEGEKRRVAIAGVLALQPEFLVLDEPTAGLDYSGVQAVADILKHYHSMGRTVLLISHNLDLVTSLVDRMVVISDGKIRFDGHKKELFQNQKLLQSVGLSIPRVLALVSSLKQKGWVKSSELYSINDIKRELDQGILAKHILAQPQT